MLIQKVVVSIKMKACSVAKLQKYWMLIYPADLQINVIMPQIFKTYEPTKVCLAYHSTNEI